jgi:branched-chain amino acid aminotransferase
MYVVFNGRILSSSKPTIELDNRSFRYGDGCFETIRVVKAKPVLFDLHMQRLFYSLRFLLFEPVGYFTADYLFALIEELVRKNNHAPMARVRLTVFRGSGGLHDEVNHTPQFLIQSWPLPDTSGQLNENGLVLGVYEGGLKSCDSYSNLKSNNYLLYAMAAIEARRRHCNDLLVMNTNRRIADATIANLWLVENDVLITPPLSEAPVDGVMRRYLLHQARGHGFKVVEEPITQERLLAAEEVFLSNAIYGLRWVMQCGLSNYANRMGSEIYRSMIGPAWV